GSCSSPFSPSHVPTVQPPLPQFALTGVFTQPVGVQVSTVQSNPSSHPKVNTHPVSGTQRSSVHGSPSSQTTGSTAQCPLWQRSLVVQRLSGTSTQSAFELQIGAVKSTVSRGFLRFSLALRVSLAMKLTFDSMSFSV